MVDAPHPARARSAPYPHRGEGPLAGIHILDLTRLLPGPMCTLYLADLGADVIKIEDIGAGDYGRTLGRSRHTSAGGMSAWYRAINRNKRSLAVDLRNAKGREAFLALARNADVIVEGFRPGVVKALGVDYAAIRAINPRIVYCALSGYGQTGPRASQAGHDVNYLGYCGVLAHTGARGGPPVLSNLQIADLLGGAASAAVAILGALLGAQRSGIGHYIDVAMTDAVLAHEVFALGAFEEEGHVAERGEDLLTGGYACYGVYETSDGGFVAVGALEAKFWRALCEALDRPELVSQQFARGEEGECVRSELASIFMMKTRDEWADRFTDIDCCVSPVLTFDEAIRDPQFAARGMIVRRPDGSQQYAPPFSMTPPAFAITRDAPRQGEHTDEVLREAGFDPRNIDALVRERAIARAS